MKRIPLAVVLPSILVSNLASALPLALPLENLKSMAKLSEAAGACKFLQITEDESQGLQFRLKDSRGRVAEVNFPKRSDTIQWSETRELRAGIPYWRYASSDLSSSIGMVEGKMIAQLDWEVNEGTGETIRFDMKTYGDENPVFTCESN